MGQYIATTFWHSVVFAANNHSQVIVCGIDFSCLRLAQHQTYVVTRPTSKPRKHGKPTQYRFNIGPASGTMDQH